MVLGRLIQQRPTASVIKRALHATARTESTLMVGGIALATSAYAAKIAVEQYEAYKARPVVKDTSTTTSSRTGGGFFSGFSSKNFYDGPFEATMTRREAALILGVRESASIERIRNAHRKLLILNHPDTGGSTFLATKLNEAKDMLTTGKK